MSFLDGIKEFFANFTGDAKEKIGEQTGLEDLSGNAQDAIQNIGDGADSAIGQAEDQVNNAKDNLNGPN